MDIYEEFKKPFPKKDILWRLGATGKTKTGVWCLPLAYVDSRAVQRRLDDVLGPQNWSNKFHDVNGGICCELSLRIDGEWYMKSDGAGQTEIDPEKGGFSGALKRATSLWGVGRYLYDLDTGFAQTSTTKKDVWNKAKKDGVDYWWQEPILPDWALPEDERKPYTPTAKVPDAATYLNTKLQALIKSDKSTADDFYEMLEIEVDFIDKLSIDRAEKFINVVKAEAEKKAKS